MTVKVQWWGGPNDGEEFVVRDDVRHITVATPPEHMTVKKLDFSKGADYPGQPLEFDAKTITLPIHIWRGKAYVRYPKIPPRPKETE